MNKAKLARFLVKGATGIVFSAFIGYTIKMEKKIEARIDDHFDAEPAADQTN